MFLQENLNQKKTASFKDIRLELLEDIIIFNEQFEELKYEVCLTENALVATSEPEEKEGLLKRMGDGAKKIWKTIIEYLTKLWDKIVNFFKDIMNKMSLHDSKIIFGRLYGNLLDAKDKEKFSTVKMIKSFDIKEFDGKLSSLFREETSDANMYKTRVDNNIGVLEELLQKKQQDFKSLQKETVSLDEAIRIFQGRNAQIGNIVGKVESANSTLINKLKGEAKKYSSENNDEKVSEIRSKISTASKAINVGLKIVVGLFNLTISASKYDIVV